MTIAGTLPVRPKRHSGSHHPVLGRLAKRIKQDQKQLVVQSVSLCR